VVFLLSPVLYVHDSNYAMLLGEHLLLRGNFQLDEHFWPAVDSTGYPEVKAGGTLPRQVRPAGGHLYYWYPQAPSVLSAPLIGALRLLTGESTIRPDGSFDPAIELLWQRRIAALLMAGLCVAFFITSRRVLSLRASLLVALAGGLATQIWSTASRAVSTQTWCVLLLALALAHLLSVDERRVRLQPVWLATLLAWAFFSRPTAAACIAPLAIWVVWRAPRRSVVFLVTGAAWLALWLGFNVTHFGTYLPPYFELGGGLHPAHLFTGLFAQLVSPSRGLVVYVPAVLFVGWLLLRYRSHLRSRELAAACVSAIAIHGLVVATFRNWWAGACYGARFYTDVVPLFVLLGILGAAAARDHAGEHGAPAHRRRWEIAALAGCLAWGLLVNGAGAFSEAGKRWNGRPVAIREQPERIFDWRRPQFLVALFPGRLPPPRTRALREETPSHTASGSEDQNRKK
jgi:hypothetical protein